MLTPFSRITSKASADGFLQLMVECACSVNAVTIMVFQTGMRELQSYRFFYVVSFCDVKCPVALLRRTGRDGLGFFTQCCLHCCGGEGVGESLSQVSFLCVLTTDPGLGI